MGATNTRRRPVRRARRRRPPWPRASGRSPWAGPWRPPPRPGRRRARGRCCGQAFETGVGVAMAGGVEGDHAEAGRDQRGDEGVQLPAPPAPAVDQVDGGVGPVGSPPAGRSPQTSPATLRPWSSTWNGRPGGACPVVAAVPVGDGEPERLRRRARRRGRPASRANDRTIVLFLIAARRLEGISRLLSRRDRTRRGGRPPPAPRRRGWRWRRRGRRAAGWRGGASIVPCRS